MSTPLNLQQADVDFQANLYESSNPTRRWLHNARRTWVLNAIRDVSTPYTRFLEIGIGCGVYTEQLARIGPVTGIDINRDFVNMANRIPNVQAVVGDITNLALDAAFDVALCSEVVEHIPDSESALSNIFRALKPGGVLILTTPHSYSTAELTARLLGLPLVLRLARHIYGESVDELGHINRMTRTELQRQIRLAGFSVLQRADLTLYLPLLAEFGGSRGQRVAAVLASWLARSALLSQLCWTQCFVLQKPGNPPQGVATRA